MEAVSTAAGNRIIKCDLKIVVSQEPIKSGPRLPAPAASPRCPIGLQAGRNDRTGFHRLLVEASLLGCFGMKALRSDGHEMAFRIATLNRDQPIRSEERRV